MLTRELFAEERQKGWTYAEKRAKLPKGAPTDAIGAIEKVILHLEGNDSGAVTRLAKRYDRLDISAKLLKDRRDALNANMKMLGDSFFDAEDSLVTRIVETASYTVMLTASEKGADKPKKEVINYEAAYTELAQLIPELTDKAKEILAKYTEMVQAKDTPMALKVKSKTISEGLVEIAKRAWRAFVAEVKSWGKAYDKKLDAIQAKYPV
jgi:vacuolar-type H+-ATPase subunit E/Vma4